MRPFFIFMLILPNYDHLSHVDQVGFLMLGLSARIASTVVPYLFAMIRSVSPRWTMCGSRTCGMAIACPT